MDIWRLLQKSIPYVYDKAMDTFSIANLNFLSHLLAKERQPFSAIPKDMYGHIQDFRSKGWIAIQPYKGIGKRVVLLSAAAIRKVRNTWQNYNAILLEKAKEKKRQSTVLRSNDLWNGFLELERMSEGCEFDEVYYECLQRYVTELMSKQSPVV